MQHCLPHASHSRALAVNVGSSSLKFAVFSADESMRRIAAGRIERIGSSLSRFEAAADGAEAERRDCRIEGVAEAFETAIDWLGPCVGLEPLAAVGHRIVHGGPRRLEHERATPGLVAELREIASYDPEHMPQELLVLQEAAARFPNAAQVACFDTAFHRTLPPVARLLPIPRRFQEAGVRRYGFHGLAYESVMRELRRIDPRLASNGRLILAHLGSGASLAAVRNGACIETTMGFSPTSGIPMGTRSGDIDPGVVRRLAHADGLSTEAIFRMLNRESGLSAVSGIGGDMADLLSAEDGNPRAAEAIEWFCHHARKAIGALAAALGGVDAVAFSGGIGERAPAIRARIADGLGFLGLRIDRDRNAQGLGEISPAGDAGRVFAIAADEESVIAEAALRVAGESSRQEALP